MDVLSGDAGKDVLRGGPSSDFLRGGAGGDMLLGEQGRDVVDVRDRVRGNDQGSGGPGSDHCRADRRDRLNGCA